MQIDVNQCETFKECINVLFHRIVLDHINEFLLEKCSL